MNLFFKLVTLFTLIVWCEAQDWVVDDDGCRTPGGGVGSCIPVKKCESMINFLKNATRPISSKVKEKLRAYLCSYKSGLNWVCCSDDPITIVDETTTRATSSTDNETPPDVTQHKNLELLPGECGLIDSNDKIRNGEDALLNEFPWMALISYKTSTGQDFKCGGTVINGKYILTAAHCITNLTYPLLGVRLGEYKISTKEDCVANRNGSKKCIGPVQDIAIEEIVPHPHYQQDYFQNDIGLLRLSAINLNTDNVKPVCLPVDEELANAELKFATVTGWGVTDSKTGKTSTVLQKVDISMVGLEECSNVYSNATKARITKRNLCAGGREGKDSCKGDSGGPLQAAAYFNGAPRYIQQGVVSYGHIHCGERGYPAVYTRVSFYMDWILDSIRP